MAGTAEQKEKEREQEKRPEEKKSKDRDSIKVEQQVSSEDAASYLGNVISGLRGGHISITHGDQTVELDTGETVKLKLKVEGGDEKRTLSIKLTWKSEQQPETGAGSLKITAGRNGEKG